MAAPSVLPATPMTSSASPQLWKRDGGCFVCFERHANESQSCGKSFVTKQALESHRKRMGCQPWKLPSDRAPSKYRSLEPEAARQLKRVSNRAAVSKYRTTLDGERAVHRARHIANYRLMARDAVPAPPMPKAPVYVRPPISWLIANAGIFAHDLKEKFDWGEIVLSHATWSLRFHPDKVEVSQPIRFGLDADLECHQQSGRQFVYIYYKSEYIAQYSGRLAKDSCTYAFIR
jgi:hypothetical protein